MNINTRLDLSEDSDDLAKSYTRKGCPLLPRLQINDE